MDADEIKKLIEKSIERDGGWTEKLPIIKEFVQFPKDDSSNEVCESCKGNCCFFDMVVKTLASGEHNFKLDGLEKSYKDFDVVKNNAKEMFRNNSYDTIDWFIHWVGNPNWARVFKYSDKLFVAYACPMLNSEERCSIYPNRPEICKKAYSADKISCVEVSPEPIAEIKDGTIRYLASSKKR